MNRPGKSAASASASVRSPASYLFRMAFNIAVDHRRARARRLARTEVDTLLDIADEAPDAARTVVARLEVEALMRIMAGLDTVAAQFSYSIMHLARNPHDRGLNSQRTAARGSVFHPAQR